MIAGFLGSGCGAWTTYADVKLRPKRGSNWFFVRRVAMLGEGGGLPCLRWSAESKRREFAVSGVEEASCVCTSAPVVLVWSVD